MSQVDSHQNHTRERSDMVERQLRERGIHAEAVLRAMQTVPRDHFVPNAERERAYEDCALPLAHGQTISQPYMVARAAELARLGPDDVVLEVGLGSGYQAAVLSRLCARVIGLEIIPELAESARRSLAELGYHNIQVEHADGSLGCLEYAPYDAIIVAAGAPQVPDALVQQLAVNGRLVIPVGDAMQRLTVLTRTSSETIITRTYDRCVYVPLRGAAGRHD